MKTKDVRLDTKLNKYLLWSKSKGVRRNAPFRYSCRCPGLCNYCVM